MLPRPRVGSAISVNNRRSLSDPLRVKSFLLPFHGSTIHFASTPGSGEKFHKSPLACVFLTPSSVYVTRMLTVAETILNPKEGEAGELARGLRLHDPEVLDRLIHRYQHRLYRYLLFLTGRRDLAEDIFQETWMRVLEKGHLYDARTKFESWLFTVARNLFLDTLRRRKASLSLDDLTGAQGEGGSFEPAATAAAPVEQLVHQEEREWVGAALSRLPAVCREVLLLRFQEDMALEEIAMVVDAPLSTVKSRLYRGLELLRRCLEEERR